MKLFKILIMATMTCVTQATDDPHNTSRTLNKYAEYLNLNAQKGAPPLPVTEREFEQGLQETMAEISAAVDVSLTTIKNLVGTETKKLKEQKIKESIDRVADEYSGNRNRKGFFEDIGVLDHAWNQFLPTSNNFLQ